MKYIFIFLIKTYQIVRNSIGQRQHCVFYPSCSQYSKEAFKRYGTLRACSMTFYRITRCHPWQKQHYDPLP